MPRVGVDRAQYHDAAVRMLSEGTWYVPEQVQGAYEIGKGHVFYPPIALFWLVPAAFLPDALWWPSRPSSPPGSSGATAPPRGHGR